MAAGRESLVIVAQSLPKRPEMGLWSQAASRRFEALFSLVIGYFRPFGSSPHLSAVGVWGTRGPEFKSRRPDEKRPCSEGLFSVQVLVGS